MKRPTAPSPPARLIGVSVPRSGHHYLVKLLGLALGDALFHCEYYTPLGCCRKTPCTRGEGARVVYQKNHDFDFSLSPDLPGVTYVVQHRDPLLAALSDREYLARVEGRRRADDVDEYVVWLGHKAAYVHRFWDKWLRPERPDRLIIDYATLLHRPVEVLSRTLDRLGILVDRLRLEQAARDTCERIADFPPVLGEPPPFIPRTIETSRYLDRDLLSVFESVVLDAVPELQPTRRLPSVDGRGHPVALVYQARMAQATADLGAAVTLLEEATRAAPGNPYLWHELGEFRAAAGDVEGALAAASEAMRRRAGHPLFLRQLSDLHLARSDRSLARSIEIARELAKHRPEDPGHLIHLATLLFRHREHGEAQAFAASAITFGSQDPQVWRQASEIFAGVENWEEAIRTARDAILRDETAAEFHHHLGNLLKRAGRVDEAIAAHAHALELAPDNPGWRSALANLLAEAGRTDEAPTRDHVLMAYRLLLGREPETEDVVRHHRSIHPDRRSLVRAFLSSAEFASRMVSNGATVPTGLEERVSSLVASFAPSEPVEPPGPEYWVDALGVRTRCSFRSDWSARGGHIVLALDGVPLEWLALLEALEAAGEELCLVELGAGHGPWLVRAGVVWRRRHAQKPLVLVGVEGEPSHTRFLEQHAADNGLPTASLRVMQGAIGTRDGTVEFEVSERPSTDWGTRVVSAGGPAGLPRVGNAGRATVPAWSLPTLLADLRHVDLLHADVQGSEGEVLASAGEVLSQKVARLFVGTHGRAIEGLLMEHLSRLGFRLVAETPCRYDLAAGAPTLVRDGEQYWLNPALTS